MCEWCNDIEAFGHYGVGATRPRLKEAKESGCCEYYIDSCRDYYIESRHRWNRNELWRIPKRDPDDPRFVLDLGEGLLPFMFSNLRDQEDWFFLLYLPTRRRKLHRLKVAGKGADTPEERVARGVEDAISVVADTTLLDFEGK